MSVNSLCVFCLLLINIITHPCQFNCLFGYIFKFILRPSLHWQLTTLKFHWATLYIGKWHHWNFIGRHLILANDHIKISLAETFHYQMTTSKFHWQTLSIIKWPHGNCIGRHFTLANDNIEISLGDVLHWQMTTLKFH